VLIRAPVQTRPVRWKKYVETIAMSTSAGTNARPAMATLFGHELGSGSSVNLC
jgi:hypothetical protein